MTTESTNIVETTQFIEETTARGVLTTNSLTTTAGLIVYSQKTVGSMKQGLPRFELMMKLGFHKEKLLSGSAAMQI